MAQANLPKRPYTVPMFSYAPPGPGGSGYAIATERFVALLSQQATPDLVTELFILLDSPGGSMSRALALLAASGEGQRFGLAEVVDTDAQVMSIAVRGDIVVDLDSAATNSFMWPDGATWLSGEARGVASLRLALGASGQAPSHLPLARGIVPAVETVARFGARSRTVEGASSTPAQSHDSHSIDRRPPRPDPSSLHAEPAWTLRLPDGNELDAAPQIVVGRRPWRTDPDETSTYYVVAPSPRREISGKHVEFAVVGTELLARDLGSTNGTLVLTSGKPPRLLSDGRAVTLDIGDTLDLGEGFRIVVGART